jgi:iron(III) transport system substrate-binding protein
VVYNTDALSEDDLPDSILGFTDPEWSGRIGWAPTNGSFQAFVTALRVLEGEDGARDWLEGIVANEPEAYEGNSATARRGGAGEVEVGFVNHYYLFQFLVEDPDFPVANKFFGWRPRCARQRGRCRHRRHVGPPDAGARAPRVPALGPAQEYFAEETYEIPVVDGVEQAAEVPDLDSLTLPEIDLDRLEDLEGTLELLNEVGAL